VGEVTSKSKKKNALTDRTFASATAKQPAAGLLNVLNLGAGVQSSVVLLMSLEGELPPIDHAIFADVGWEPAAVYRQLDWLQTKAEAAGVKVWRVRRDGQTIRDWELGGEMRNSKQFTTLPYFTVNDTEKGQVKRQCTNHFKIQPIKKCIRRDVLGLAPRQRAPKEPVINQWFGISFDEMQRMRSAEDKFILNWYPLVSRMMTRESCREWLRTRGYPEAPRSACIGCPYRHNSEWRALKENPEEWQDAVKFDAAIRNCGGMRGEVFLHADRIPLPLVNLEKKYDPRQQTFGFDDECAGMCGV
jgi:hypothetical protein